MEGGTIFHFVQNGIEAAPEQAFNAADRKDVRIGGGLPSFSSTFSPV